MKSTSKELLEKVSKHCATQLTMYKFNTILIFNVISTSHKITPSLSFKYSVI